MDFIILITILMVFYRITDNQKKIYNAIHTVNGEKLKEKGLEL